MINFGFFESALQISIICHSEVLRSPTMLSIFKLTFIFLSKSIDLLLISSLFIKPPLLKGSLPKKIFCATVRLLHKANS